MTEQEYNEFRNQYPDAVILERIESETDEEIAVKYVAYCNDAYAVITCADKPFSFHFTRQQVDKGQCSKVEFDAKYLDIVVNGLTHNMKRVVFVSCNK